jgi:RNA polymerase sigma-70 factor (ECF subfamily)
MTALALVGPAVDREDPDRALAERAARGDRGAFARLVQSHQRAVYSIALAVLRDADLAWDAAQETFLRLHARIASFRGDAPLKTWISRIALHVAVDQRRRAQRIPEQSVDLTALSSLPDPQRLADEEFERGEMRAQLEEAFAQLGETQRTVLVLREVEGHSYAQIARATRVPVGTVMSRLYYARRALRELLETPGFAVLAA